LVARHFLQLPDNISDKLKDIDAYVDTSVDIEKIAKKFQSDTQGFSPCADVSAETIVRKLHNVDCTINQLFVTHKAIYLTPECEEALKTGIVEACHQGIDMYATNSYEKNGEIIYAATII
jgi:hypothetical protein